LITDVPNDFERELERELRRRLDPLVAAPVPPRTAPARGGWMPKLLAGAGAAVAAKMVMGIAIAALAAGFAGMATEAVITRSLSPVQWSQQAKDQVLALESQHGSAINQHHATTSPATNLAGAANGNGQAPVIATPAQAPNSQPPNPLQDAPPSPPQPNAVTVPPGDATASPKPKPPLCGPGSTDTAGGC
jgi:hypothetical protein